MKRMYLLLRLDLAANYMIGQGAHALASFVFEHPDEFTEWNNGTISALGIRNVSSMRELMGALTYFKNVFSVWNEPDQEGAPTAIACYAEERAFHQLPPM